MTDKFSYLNSISCTEDRHELRVTGMKWRLPDIVSGTGEIFISGAAHDNGQTYDPPAVRNTSALDLPLSSNEYTNLRVEVN